MKPQEDTETSSILSVDKSDQSVQPEKSGLEKQKTGFEIKGNEVADLIMTLGGQSDLNWDVAIRIVRGWVELKAAFAEADGSPHIGMQIMAISEGLLIPPTLDVYRPGANWGPRVEECWIEFWAAFAGAFQLDPGERIFWVDSYDDDEFFTGCVRFRMRPWEYRERKEPGCIMKQINKPSGPEFGKWNGSLGQPDLIKAEPGAECGPARKDIVAKIRKVGNRARKLARVEDRQVKLRNEVSAVPKVNRKKRRAGQ